ncbi:MAG: DNA repair protein RadC [Acidobacteriia bacterium]|nr:DNA repair protein RadC [Terriglobia bacterium]
MPDDDPVRVSEAVPSPALYVVRQPIELGVGSKPRDKILRRGIGALSNTELLTVIMDSRATRHAAQLIRTHGVAALPNLTVGELLKSAGVTKPRACRLAATFELYRRLMAKEEHERPKLHRPSDAYAQVLELRHARKEHLVGLYLDAQNGLLHRETLSIGSLNTTRTHPREILYPAVLHLALGFILAHNHPSGCLDPSDEDVEFTRAVKRAGELVGIELYDHLVVGNGGYTSLRERGTL